MTTKTILLIHHEPNLQEVVQACLSDLGGWNILTSASLAEGLQQAIRKRPDAIVIELPPLGMEGLLLLHELRAQAFMETIPVILLVSRSKWVDAKLIQPYQVTGTITIPCDPNVLSEQIARLLKWNVHSAEDHTEAIS